jgi:predicted GIY-YIG superfamily endonuclease
MFDTFFFFFFRCMNKGDILVYCVARDPSNTYVGWTNNWPRRLRQHNGALKGGAASTRMRRDPLRPWRPLFLVTGFASRRHARQLEWFLHAKRLTGAQTACGRLCPRALYYFGAHHGRVWPDCACV